MNRGTDECAAFSLSSKTLPTSETALPPSTLMKTAKYTKSSLARDLKSGWFCGTREHDHFDGGYDEPGTAECRGPPPAVCPQAGMITRQRRPRSAPPVARLLRMASIVTQTQRLR